MPLGAGDLCGATSDEDLERSQKSDLKRGSHGGGVSAASGPVWHGPTRLCSAPARGTRSGRALPPPAPHRRRLESGGRVTDGIGKTAGTLREYRNG
jgi:hypothetical protein